MLRVANRLVPARMGSSFRWLLASSWTTNLGDGVAAAAGPLLVASLTNDPFLISLAALLRWAPPLLFGLYAGVLSDRHDRRRIMILADGSRAVVLAALVAAFLAGRLDAAGALLALGVLATAEIFADNAASTVTPMLVSRDDLALANARLQVGFLSLNQLAGPPIGAALFAAGRAWPFVTQAVLVAAGVLLVSRVRPAARQRLIAGQRRASTESRATAERPGTAETAVEESATGATPAMVRVPGVDDGRATSGTRAAAERRAMGRVGREMCEGFAWTMRHAAVRTLVLTILIFNVTFGAAWSVLVLYAQDRLGLDALGFGLLSTSSAVGGLLGTGMYGWITARVSLGNVMRAGLVIETLTHLALAVTTSAPVALAIFFVFGAHAFVWGTTSITVRQRAVPSHLQGRVGSVNTICVYGGLVVGSALGGALATHFGVTAPFWFAFAGSAVFVVLLWPQLTRIAHTEERRAVEPA